MSIWARAARHPAVRHRRPRMAAPAEASETSGAEGTAMLVARAAAPRVVFSLPRPVG
jgi:hypothetical protein